MKRVLYDCIIYKPIKTRNSKFPGRLGSNNILGTKLNYGKKNSKT